MNAHQLDADGVIINTIVVDSLDVLPDLVDAEIGGGVGDSIIDGVLAPKVPPLPTVAQYTAAVQNMLDEAARALNYDDIVSACSYAAAPNPFQQEGTSFVTWRGACWAKCYQTMADVQSGTIPQPTIAELLAMMPARVEPV